MKFILLLLLPSCIIGEVIRLQFPVFTFQPLKFTFPGATFSSRNGNSPAAASSRVSSVMSPTTSTGSSNNESRQPTTFTPLLVTRLQPTQQMPAVATRSSVQQTSTLMSTNRNNNVPNGISTRVSFDDSEPSTVRQNSLPGLTTSINRNTPTTRNPATSSQPQQTSTPGNVARQIKLLMSRSRGGIAAPSIGTRSNTLSSGGSASGPPCSTPDGESGVCAHVSSCNLFLPYMDLLDQPAVQAFFIERTCRITNMEVHVCCPRSPFAQGPTLRTAVPVIPTESECGFPSTNRLVNGEQVSVGSWPWLVTIGLPRNDNTFFHVCGGTLITRRHVLTAAHCFEPDSLRPRPTHVRLGEHHLESDNDGAMFQQRIIRGRRTFGYQPTTRRNDIELLILDADVTFSDFVRPACLPINVNERENDFLGEEVTVVGWGKTAAERSAGSLVPLQVDLPVTPIGSCSELYRSVNITVDNRNICAGGQGRDSCQGDSGGPLNYLNRSNGRYYVVGIVSHGLGCGTYPGVYTRVGSYINWILNTVR